MGNKSNSECSLLHSNQRCSSLFSLNIQGHLFLSVTMIRSDIRRLRVIGGTLSPLFIQNKEQYKHKRFTTTLFYNPEHLIYHISMEVK